MDAGFDGIGDVDDSRARAFLWRNGTTKECAWNHHAELCCARHYHGTMGIIRILARFGPDIGHVIGSLKWIGLNGVGLTPNPDYAPTIPHQCYMLFQMMFAVITPALITGAFAERFKFKTYLVFLLLWATFVYDPLAHWVWGTGGWIRNFGALDFAGGLVVHVSWAWLRSSLQF